MGQKNLIRHDFFLFNGVSAYTEANKTPEDKLYYAENSRFAGGRWGNSQGYVAFDTFTGGTNIKGLLEYQRFPSGVETDYLVAYYNSQFERIDEDGVSTSIAATGWTGGDVAVEGVSYNGNLYVCNGVDDIGKIADTTFSTVVDSPNARLLEEWGEKLWAVDNVAPASVQYTRTATASTPANIEDWTTVGAAGAELIGKGGRIESIRRLKNKFYCFKNNWIEEFYEFDYSGANPVPRHLPISQTTGAVNHRACIVVENDIWFLTPDLQIRSLGQEANYQTDPRVADLSSVVDRYKRTLDPDQSGACAIYDENKVFKLALKSQNSSQNDVIFTYDYEARGWGFDKHTSPTDYAKVGKNSYFCVGGTNGIVYKDNTGYSANSTPMSFTGKTGLKDDGVPDLKKYARKFYIRGARSEDLAFDAILVGEDYEVLETHTVTAPTVAEIAAGAVAVDGLAGQVGDIVGEEGYTGGETGLPPVYRFHREFSCGSNARMFGCIINTFVRGQRIFIDDIKLKYIPRETYATD